MSKAISRGGPESRGFRIRDKIVEIIVPLFNWIEVEMVNIKTRRRSKRLIWTLSNSTISLCGSAKRGGSVLKEPPEYDYEVVKPSQKYRKGIKKVRVRISLDGLAVCAHKLSTLVFADNDMSLSIFPSQLRELCERAISNGNTIETNLTYKLVFVRSNDLRRDPEPKGGDRWLVFSGSPNLKMISERLPSINQLEEQNDSPWRLDMSVQQIIPT